MNLSKLVVGGDVYLSTGAGKRTGIGNILPGYTLDVTGDINASGSLLTGNTIRISNGGSVGSGGLDATWDGVTINVNRGGTGVNTLAAGGILYGNDAADIGATAVLGNGQLLIGDGSGVPTLAVLTQASANRVVITIAAGSITLSLPQDIHTGAVPQFAGLTAAYIKPSANGVTAFQLRRADGTNILNVDSTNNRIGINTAAPDTDLHVNGNIKTVNFQMTSGGALNYVLASDNAGNASWVNPAAGGLGDGFVGNEITNVANATLTRSGSGTAVLPWLVALNLANANTWTATQIFTSTIAAVLSGTIAGNDFYRIMGGATANESGYLEIATADDGNEPIYVRQYTNPGIFTALVRTATLLDAAGDTSFPGTVTAPTFSGAFSGTLTGNASNVSGVVATANGGTGSGVVATARANLVAAKSGANSDITSLTGLTTALSIGQGGTGNTAVAAGLVRSNGTALSGAATVALATEVGGMLGLTNGGTGAASAGAALTSLGAAALGSNSDITALNAIAGPIKLFSVNMATLLTLNPGVGRIYYCNDCNPKKVVVSTGTSAGNFAAIDGGTFE